MQANRALFALGVAVLLAATLWAQSPSNDIDVHISAAKAAAGLDYCPTFVNLWGEVVVTDVASPRV